MRIDFRRSIPITLLSALIFGLVGCAATVALPAPLTTSTSDGQSAPLAAGISPRHERPAPAPEEEPNKRPIPPATAPPVTATAPPSPTSRATIAASPTAAPTETIALPLAAEVTIEPPPLPSVTQIGNSVEGRPINSYRLGSGVVNIVLVGGIHGGSEWNSIMLVQEFLRYYQANETEIPPSITIHVVPNINPDGLAIVTGGEPTDLQLQPTDIISDTSAGRFNAHGVDLNRNWDCNWVKEGRWRDETVSAGLFPFSEPESENLRRFLIELNPDLVVFFHSMAGGIYGSGCPDTDPESSIMAAVYGLAAGYPVYPMFTYYPISGDASDWLTTQGIPSFTVELTTREAIDWEQNLAGLQATLEYVALVRQAELIEGIEP